MVDAKDGRRADTVQDVYEDIVKGTGIGVGACGTLGTYPEIKLAAMKTPAVPNAVDFARRNAELVANFRIAWKATCDDPTNDEKYQKYRGLLIEMRARGIDAGQALLRMAHRSDMAADDARRYFER